MATHANNIVSAADALTRLREGNARFVRGETITNTLDADARQQAATAEQRPFAIVLGCSDSRVPAELIFDQGIGDLFVIRVAGNVVAPSQVGSVEFAAARFQTRLVVVLGHSNCGAVGATIEALQSPGGVASSNVLAIVDRIRPALQPLVEHGHGLSSEQLLAQGVRANVGHSAGQLRHGSAVLEGLISSEGLQVVGAEYDLKTGVVTFFDGVGGG